MTLLSRLHVSMAVLMTLLAALLLWPIGMAAAVADTEVPVLTSFSRDVAALSPGQTQTLRYSVTENSGVLQAVIFTYDDPLGGSRQIRRDGALPLSGEVTLAIPDTWPNGLYQLSAITLSDPTRNIAYYWDSGLISKSPAGAAGPTTHAFDFDPADFDVVGSSADTEVPVLTSFSRDVAALSPGQTQTLRYSVTENSGVLQAVIFTYDDPLGGSRQIRRDGALPLSGVVTLAIPGTWPNGLYQLSAITLSDPTRNIAYYWDSGLISKSPAGAAGPTTHAFDFDPADFLVNDGSLTAPSEPQTPTTRAGDAQIDVFWQPPTSNGGSPITGYLVTSSPGGKTALSTGATTATVSGLTNGISYTFTVVAINAVGVGPASRPSDPVTPGHSVSRVSGANRYATAAAIAQTYAVGPDVVYVASGEAFPDALAGAALAGDLGAPVLLTRATSLPSATVAALQALAPKRIVVLGGTAAVSTAVETQLETFTP